MRLTFELTQKCNMKCKYCNAEKKAEGELPIEVIELACREISKRTKIDYVTFTGGESLLYSHLEEALFIASKYTKHILLLTNGLLLGKDSVVEVLQKYGVEVHVSMDSIDAGYHDTYRGNHELILNNVLKLKEKTSLPIGIVCVVSSKNYLYIPEINSFCGEKGFNLEYELLDVEDTDILSIKNLNSDAVNQLLSGLEDWAERFNNKVKYHLINVLLKNKSYVPTVCYGCKNNVIVFSDGNVGFCFKNKEKYFGDVRECETIDRIINSGQEAYDGSCFSYKCLGNFL